MSQHWHGHWIEENYKPKRLGNWEISNWYPEWPVRHCKKTTFQSDNKGHLLAHIKRTNRGRDNFKTAWELPKKINRLLAQELSAPPKYKKQIWEAHKANYRASCKTDDYSRNEIKLEKILTQKSSAKKKIEPKKSPKPIVKRELKEKLIDNLEKDTRDSDIKSNSTELNSNLKILTSDTNSESHCTEEKINKILCLLHQTCKI